MRLSADKIADLVLPTAHIPVLLDEVISTFAPSSCERGAHRFFLDATLGGGGHSEALLRADENNIVFGVDQDPSAINRTNNRMRAYSDRFFATQGNFGKLSQLVDSIALELPSSLQMHLCADIGRPLFDGILLDLGLSSDQLNDSTRGFSFAHDGPLDMRMDPGIPISAAELLNTSSLPDLIRIFKLGGLRAECTILARQVLDARPLNSTAEFAAICVRVLGPRAFRKKRLHPSAGTRTSVRGAAQNPATVPFQALRIAVNKELEQLQAALDLALGLLRPGGKLAVISFHSLEDKLVASTMRRWAMDSTPRGLAVERQVREGKLLTPHAKKASATEIARNSRARSALMRVFERTDDLSFIANQEVSHAT